ncbi:TPA: hypothetical protein L5W20_005914 [Pseudomonas aeruginosa]|uniref:hypothetical protein n=1 Tax=Pseudomonas aeruginosa TaxID=287 RepID=UPI00053E6259|nr:hypothetical protein [Pseudomonas aeruginosa]EMB4100968.1 hypothetical protein [Pseudomonas aeruginosa]MBA4881737.1 hypothetical protein [Pseudomonas aeruginosa]MBA5313871.1 hypothetical protein [Pseudomonas aeruginosa]MBF3089955.1 hypothetical protein [Pseudomonas aeruginosa]MBG4424649.1 hypothetical protein [Pseudomonas aeruginosa]
MTIYVSALSAIVSALSADCIDNTAKQAWQKLYQPGYAESEGLSGLIRGSNTSGIKRIDADCWVHARLHSQLKPRHWNALVAKYSTHRGKKVQAISALAPVIASHAPQLFVMKAVTAWAIPQMKGVDGKRSTDMIVLPQHFYDINSWDSQGLNRTTYWRWKRGVERTLDEMINEALTESENILRMEGVLVADVA